MLRCNADASRVCCEIDLFDCAGGLPASGKSGFKHNQIPRTEMSWLIDAILEKRDLSFENIEGFKRACVAHDAMMAYCRRPDPAGYSPIKQWPGLKLWCTFKYKSGIGITGLTGLEIGSCCRFEFIHVFIPCLIEQDAIFGVESDLYGGIRRKRSITCAAVRCDRATVW